MRKILSPGLDLIGIGIGPSNLSTAALLEPVKTIRSLFFDNKKEFEWFPGMLFPEATVQVSWLKDLATLVDPTSKYTFLSFLAHQKRIYRFSIARFPRVKRREFSQYFNWVSRSLPNLVFDTRVEEVTFSDGLFRVVHNSGAVSARNIVLASGQTPKVPDFVRPHLCSSVFHATQYNTANISPKGKRIIVVGGGQSGAEIFSRLLSNREELPETLHWISQRPNFLPIDDSPFTNEFFTPSYSEHFYHLPHHEKAKLIAEQTLASDGINLDLLEDIYRRLYELDLIEGKNKIARLHFNCSLQHFGKENTAYVAGCIDKFSGSRIRLDADLVIFATGFEYKPPCFMEPLLDRINMKDGKFIINEDFSISWNGPDGNRIYIQNGARHVRGVADPNLSLLAWRSAKIINSLAGHTVYDIGNESSVFDWQDHDHAVNHTGYHMDELLRTIGHPAFISQLE